MKKISNILAGTDFSESSQDGLAEALRIARDTGANLTILHVVDTELANHVERATNLSMAEILDHASDRLVKYLDDILGSDHGARVEALIGCPFVEILRAAKTHAVDLLVLGSGGSEMDGVHAGVLARRCVRKVPAMVLLVRERLNQPFRSVVACVDFSDNSNEAVELAAQVANQDGADLHLLHVARPVVPSIHGDHGTFAGTRFFDISLPPYPELDYAQQQKDKLDALAKELLTEKYPELKVESHVFTDARRPSHGIVAFLGEREADLVVLGTRGRTGVRSLLLGTTAERIVDHSPCSVLAIKPPEFDYDV
ncbi:MAG: universal stress protein E [Verrucomicrobiales bacterium]|jgi:universal stress protein E